MTKDEIFQIKIILDGIKPKIWRRFQVESNITFHGLHNPIQIKEWLGEDYDPEHFDVHAVNLELRQQFPKKGEKNPDGRARYWVMRTEK
ncbi:hypothetical protein HYY74_04610 [Candidatus Woesearchaeota archaeon]|nr:hypothetical protein [Candidatus Woesearchaeota archaeon]